MNPKLSPRMLEVLRAIAERRPKEWLRLGDTVRALWRRGLIEDVTRSGLWEGYKLTAEGKLALKNGRQMLSRREP